jgi:hypothetical protein
MTNELQADVQAKLYRALGDRGTVASSATGTSGGSRRGQQTASAASGDEATSPNADGVTAADLYGVGMDPSMARYMEYVDEEDDEEDFVGETTEWKSYDDMLMLDGNGILLQELDGGMMGDVMDESAEWECGTCTLINPPMVLVCTVCGMPRDVRPATEEVLAASGRGSDSATSNPALSAATPAAAPTPASGSDTGNTGSSRGNNEDLINL